MLTSELEAQILSAENQRLRRVDRIKTAIIYALIGLLLCAAILVAAVFMALPAVTP